MARQEAFITPSVIKWSRKKAHYSLEEAAKKISINSQKLEQWENGKSRPTMLQAQTMSQVYRRPLAAFYLPEPPKKDFSLLRDFRTVAGQSPEYSPPLVFLMRQIQERQIWLKEHLKDQGYKKLNFIGSGRLQSSPKTLSKNIIRTFWGSEQKYQEILKNIRISTLLDKWLSRCEEEGVFISRTSNLNSHNIIKVEEARGFVISDPYAPFIFINSGDSKNAQLFTLLHELAHLWLNISGVSDHFPSNNTQIKKSEFLCNQTAAEILMPEDKIKSFPKIKNLSKDRINEFIAEHSKKFKVSSLSLLVRLKSFSMINKSTFEVLKQQYETEYKNYKAQEKKRMKEAKGGPNANLLKIYANGKSFTKIVTFSYKEGLISGREASNLLDMKLNRMAKIIPMLS